MANLSKTTRDHEEIRRWAEERGGKPSHVKNTGSAGDIGILRIDFPGYSGEGSLEPITWDQFFEKFDERDLSLVYQEETAAGERSNFNKIVSAETAQEAGTGQRGFRKEITNTEEDHEGCETTRQKTSQLRRALPELRPKKLRLRRPPPNDLREKRSRPRRPAKKATGKKTATKKAAGKKTSAKKAGLRRR